MLEYMYDQIINAALNIINCKIIALSYHLGDHCTMYLNKIDF